MPLITTLIPAYKPQHLAQALQGLARQSCRDFRVILSDDSPGQGITRMLRQGEFGRAAHELDIECVAGPGNARLNKRALIDRWDGRTPFVHLHLDDDVVYPHFYRAHLEAHAEGPFSVSVSRRWMSRDDAEPQQGFELPDLVARSPLHRVPLDASALFQSVVPTCSNWLGEFTNMLLSSAGAAAWPRAWTDQPNYLGWPDVGFLLEAVQRQPIVVLREHLSVFRSHAAQTSRHMHDHGGRVSSLAWTTYALMAWQQGRIRPEQAVQAITLNVRLCLERYGDADPVINRSFDIVQTHGRSLVDLHAAWMMAWRELLSSHPCTAPETALA